MNIFVEVSNFSGNVCASLEKRLGATIADIILFAIFFVVPLTLVSLPWQFSKIAALILSFATIVCIFCAMVLNITGHKDVDRTPGFLDQIKSEGFSMVLTLLLVYLLCVVLNYGVVFAALDSLMPGRHFVVSHPSWLTFDFVYFSFVTMFTLGYGDIVPISWLAKLLSITELVFGLQFLFIGLGQIVGAAQSPGNGHNRGQRKRE
ncbi:membrane hypothetical protein [uncultured Desulfobacterium sp.]|uniref:Potassium channel domain-containing protein n=1 Tax=uncultured Desulfobacterium sp. TaxID=201089 RepID=A0A445MRT8_9BACT|nr:membrane hypothetical protein [uncultured Desulfobacterium sp.]